MAVRRQHKRYSTPRRLFEKIRIDEENALLKTYGLKNKREIWKADFAVNKIRDQAKLLITAPSEYQKEFIGRLIAKGLVKKGAQIDDVLALTKEAIMDRRLQTIVLKKGITKTAKSARQLITHRHIMVNNEKVTIPSYFVNLSDEGKILFIGKERKHQPEEKETKQ
jgi:small subunit ribosomal protein S4